MREEHNSLKKAVCKLQSSPWKLLGTKKTLPEGTFRESAPHFLITHLPEQTHSFYLCQILKNPSGTFPPIILGVCVEYASIASIQR